jgi:predicted PP-loop superfamily ATPase
MLLCLPRLSPRDLLKNFHDGEGPQVTVARLPKVILVRLRVKVSFCNLIHFPAVVVAMSGGVDSSVAMKLLADQVCAILECIINLISTNDRTLTCLRFTCGIGMLVMKQAQTSAVSGRKTGRMFSVFAGSLTRPVEWSGYTYQSDFVGLIRRFRLI